MPGSYLHCEISATVKSDRSDLKAEVDGMGDKSEQRPFLRNGPSPPASTAPNMAARETFLSRETA